MRVGTFAVWAWACACACLSGGALAAPRYSIRMIEPADPGYWTDGNSINDRGEVVGVLNSLDKPDRAFFWGGSGLAQMLPLPAATAHAINNRGDVLGLTDGGGAVYLRSADGSVRTV